MLGATIHVLRHFRPAADSDCENTAIVNRDGEESEQNSEDVAAGSQFQYMWQSPVYTVETATLSRMRWEGKSGGG
jgi:hypothetical protein